MEYLGNKIPKLGFGLMRLPMLGEEVDLPQSKQMVDLFMSKGFTYFDTAYGYINGKSEEAVKPLLVDRYPRESFQLATKLPAWAGVTTTQEAQAMFWTSLQRTGAGYFDFYLLHNLGDNRTKSFDDFDIWNFVKEQKKEGRIKHIGFSFHDKADVLDQLLQEHPDVEFVQLQINYADWESPTVESRKCYEVAQAHNKPIIIMEPVKGGSLAALPPQIDALLKEYDPQASSASWALRYAASLDGLITVLSGMSTLEQMQDNLAFMEDFTPLTAPEQATIHKVQSALSALPTIPCTNCRYCVKGCPENIPIPQIFSVVNNYLVYQDLESTRNNYRWETSDAGKASSCIACGQCEEACPQHISIIDELEKAAALFE
ncbi:MAG: aldo/keto reductase [Lachnospiraceae bacterium]